MDFYFDDFFASADDTGIEITPVIRGQAVPMRVRRVISYADREAARLAAIQYKISGSGQVTITGMDQAVYQVTILAKTLLEWPFKTRLGEPVEISVATLKAMGADAVDAIIAAVQKVVDGEEQAGDPFESPSDAAS